MNKKIETLIILSFTFLLIGCYTQFTRIENRYTDVPEDFVPDTTAEYIVDSTAEDQSAANKDTVIVKEREVCYWHRTFLGEWELRCYKTNYSNYYHSYYSRPWWYSQYNVSYHPYSYHCPYHSYYHASCEYCWYHYDKYYYWNSHNYWPHHYNTGTSGNTSGPKKGRPKLKPLPSGAGGSKQGLTKKNVLDANDKQIQNANKKVKLKKSSRRKVLRSVIKEEKKSGNQSQKKVTKTNQNNKNTQVQKKEQGKKQWPRKRRPTRKKD
jgi:hypothetical protein